jgi:serine/threonine-protein kinase HipA
MGIERCTLELWLPDRGWSVVGTLTVKNSGLGYEGPARFDYAFDYIDEAVLDARDARAVSYRYPVGYGSIDEPRWPAFVLDVIPSGAGRRYWERRLRVQNTSASDFRVLRAGAAHPPGNIRIAEAVASEPPLQQHRGFHRSEVLRRGEDFIEYAFRSGAPVSGSTDAGGDSPKFLLREDHDGRFHADGALTDDLTARCWLVKFPRTRDTIDRVILEAEAAYHRVAQALGLHTFGTVSWEQDCLFVPRFDRIVTPSGVLRLGLESLCSIAGVSDFGAPVSKLKLARALALSVGDRNVVLEEFIARDVLDVAMGNTDNHARNTAVLKDHNGRVGLSPLYDFAPMMLDPRGIHRGSRWEDGLDHPDWSQVADTLAPLVEAKRVRGWLLALSPKVARLEATMRDAGVPHDVVAQCKPRIRRVQKALEAVRP